MKDVSKAVVDMRSRPLLLCLFLSILFAGCQTTEDRLQLLEDLNADLNAFRVCAPSDGMLSGSLQIGDGPDVNFSMEYVADLQNDWQVQALSPIGQKLFSVKADQGKISSSAGVGVSALEFQIERGSDDFLRINNQFVGIKVAEIPCVLLGCFPRSWIERDRLRQSEASGNSLRMNEAKRSIVIHPEFAPKQRCATIEWGGFWIFFKKSLRWCVVYGKSDKGSSVNFMDRAQLSLSHMEDGES